jgi:hypothetical protein
MNQQQAKKLQEIIDNNKSQLGDGLYLQLSNQLMEVHNNPPPKYYKLTYVVPCLGCSSKTMTYYLDKDSNSIRSYDFTVENFGINLVVKTSIHDLNHESLKGHSDASIASTLKSSVSTTNVATTNVATTNVATTNVATTNVATTNVATTNVAITVPYSLLQTTEVSPSGSCIDLTHEWMKRGNNFFDRIHILTHLPERPETDDSEGDSMNECIDERQIGIFVRTVVVISVELF